MWHGSIQSHACWQDIRWRVGLKGRIVWRGRDVTTIRIALCKKDVVIGLRTIGQGEIVIWVPEVVLIGGRPVPYRVSTCSKKKTYPCSAALSRVLAVQGSMLAKGLRAVAEGRLSVAEWVDCRCASQILASKSKAGSSKETVGKTSKSWGESEWSYRQAVNGKKRARR